MTSLAFQRQRSLSNLQTAQVLTSDLVLRQPPFLQNTQFSNGNLATLTSLSASNTGLQATISAVNPANKNPYTWQYSLGVQRQLPWAVLLGSPLVALGALFGVWMFGFDNNVYVQIGLVMLIGLAAKNAILIVEFAKAKHDEGLTLEDAALTSARLRFRPILMTAFAFILGVIPLMKASGAGAGAQNVMGTGVFFGMLVATGIGVFIIPGNYAFIEGLWRRKKETAIGPPPQPIEASPQLGLPPLPVQAGGGHS